MTKDSRSGDKLNFDIKVVLARNYINNLSDEVKKGMRGKVAQGGYPHWAPIGYLNSNGNIIVDPEKAHFIRKIFKLYTSGTYSLSVKVNSLYVSP